MKPNVELLQKIGLTSSEAKVYLALLEIGKFTSKKDILKISKIAPSKVYHVLDKLMDKGLVSTILKDNIKHFKAAPPKRLRDYIAEKKLEIQKEEETAEEILPQLEKLYESVSEQATAEIYVGWKGMETVYSRMITELNPGDYLCTLGASKGEDEEKTSKFFNKFGLIYYKKKLKLKVLLEKTSKKYMETHEKRVGYKLNIRYLSHVSPVEICMVKHLTLIVILKKQPMVIAIRDIDTAKAFKRYFDSLWKIASD